MFIIEVIKAILLESLKESPSGFQSQVQVI